MTWTRWVAYPHRVDQQPSSEPRTKRFVFVWWMFAIGAVMGLAGGFYLTLVFGFLVGPLLGLTWGILGTLALAERRASALREFDAPGRGK